MLLNLGKFDRSIRIVLGLAIGLMGILISGHPNLGRALGFVGALVILSGAYGSSLAYRLLGLSSKKKVGS